MKFRCVESVISVLFQIEGGRVSCGVNELKAEFRHCWLPTCANETSYW